ncbi:MAG TPA: hypothetical protein VK770_08585 [Candidatus Acidoferrum sp.]|nr:hypothetical protein [Candidatus Acidoferrum sp.]
MPPPPKTDVPRCSKPPNNKLGNSDKPDPRSEFEKPEPPKPEFPKPELAKSPLPKRLEPPKFVIERPPEKDEKDENRDVAGEFEKRLEPNPPR